MTRLLPILAGFAAGAAAVYFVDLAVIRRRERRLLEPGEPLHERVNAQLPLLVSYPDAIEVSVEGGLVRVSGYVLSTELDRLLSNLTGVPGVHKVHNALSSVPDRARLDEIRREARQSRVADSLES